MPVTTYLSTTLFALADEDKGDLRTAARSVWEFLSAGGLFMIAIGVCSVFAITVILYKAISLRQKNVLPDETIRAIRTASDPEHPGGAAALKAAIADDESPLGRIASVAASSKLKSRAEAQETVQSYARAELVRLDGGVPALDVVVTIAPLLGLLGTASGLVGVFGAFDGSAIADVDSTKLASGIARALGTTIAGIAVAVPTVVAHSFFSKKIEKLAVEMEIRIGALLNRLHPAPAAGFHPATSAAPVNQPNPTAKKQIVGELASAVAAVTAASDAQPQNKPQSQSKPGSQPGPTK